MSTPNDPEAFFRGQISALCAVGTRLALRGGPDWANQFNMVCEEMDAALKEFLRKQSHHDNTTDAEYLKQLQGIEGR